MKKMLVGLILAVALVGAPALAQHTPVPNSESCPNPFANPYTPIPTFNITDANFAAPALSWPTPGTYDFCGMLDTVFCSLAPLSGLLGEEVAGFAYLVQCLNADINGPIDEEADIPVTPNGIPDGQFELGLLARVLNTPSHPNHQAALTAFQGNTTAIKTLVVEALSKAPINGSDKPPVDVRGIVAMAAPHLVGSLCSVLGGFAVLGDAQTNAALDQLIGLLADIGLTPPEGGLAAITTALPKLGPEGDADGDGASNRKEYNYFKAQGPAATITAQLDPNQTPPNLAFIAGGGKYEVGATVNLRVVFIGMDGAGATFQWFKSGTPIGDATGSSLLFAPVTLADGGAYFCEVNIPDKATVFVTDPTILTVLPEGSLPVAGGMGLALLAGACALAGAVGIRRRK